VQKPLHMPDLAAMLVRSSLSALGSHGARCAECCRTPLAGERMHELASGKQLCDLCFAAIPEDRREEVGSRRVGASERKLAVVPKAA
jgi:hypothetical protein